MRVAIDTNILLDLLLERAPFYEDSARIFAGVVDGRITACVSATSVTTVFYVAARTVGSERALDLTRRLLPLIEIIPVTRRVITHALNTGNRDFEDAVIAEAARGTRAEVIVSRDPKGFRNSGLKVQAPLEFLTRLARL